MLLTHVNVWQSIGKPHSCTQFIRIKPLLHKITVFMYTKQHVHVHTQNPYTEKNVLTEYSSIVKKVLLQVYFWS